MRFLLIALTILLLVLQYQLWIAGDGIQEVWRLQGAVEAQKQENADLLHRNQSLEAEVLDLKHGQEAVEERARSDLGMILPEETFFLVVESDDAAAASASPEP